MDFKFVTPARTLVTKSEFSQNPSRVTCMKILCKNEIKIFEKRKFLSNKILGHTYKQNKASFLVICTEKQLSNVHMQRQRANHNAFKIFQNYIYHSWRIKDQHDATSSSVGPVANATDVLQPSRLIVLTLSSPTCLDIPMFTDRCPQSPNDTRDPSNERWDCGRELTGNFAWDCDLHVNSGIFYMPQIYDMGPTTLLPFQRKACWEFFRHEKSWRLWPGLNPRTWVLKDSKLPLNHRSHFHATCCFISLLMSSTCFGH